MGDSDSTPGGQRTSTAFPYPLYQQLRHYNRPHDDIVAFKDVGRLTANIGGEAVTVQGQMVSGNDYGALGVKPALGRAIFPSDDAVPGSGAVAVISESLWTRRFGHSASAIGETIDLNGTPMTIIGVNPRWRIDAKALPGRPSFVFNWHFLRYWSWAPLCLCAHSLTLIRSILVFAPTICCFLQLNCRVRNILHRPTWPCFAILKKNSAESPESNPPHSLQSP